MKKTPYIVKVYLLLAAFLIALPTIGTKFYYGQTGRFLVASENIRYEPFRESVIYIHRHNLFGAFGLVINKPIDPEKLRQVTEDIDISEETPPLKLGGPVGFPERITALHGDLPGEPQRTEDIPQDASLEEVIRRVERYPHKQIYLGYAGWGALQLEIEILRGSWSVVDAPKNIIFEDVDSFTLWRDLKEKRTEDRYVDQKI